MGFFNQTFKRRVFVTQKKGQGLKKKRVTTYVCLSLSQGNPRLITHTHPQHYSKISFINLSFMFSLHTAVEEDSPSKVIQ